MAPRQRQSRTTTFTTALALAAFVVLVATPAANGLTLDLVANSTAVASTLNSTQFDYVVVGGGNAGLAVASRLSSSYNVLVLEAGTDQSGNAGVTVPGLAGSPLGSGIDWGFSTVPQSNADGRSVYWPRGKMLGGSSGLNFLVSTRPNKAELDQWSSLSGSSSWSWSSLFPYFKKTERFYAPCATKPEGVTPTYNSYVHGYSGPMAISYPPYLGKQNNGFYQAVQQMGVPVAQDLHTGSNHGVNLSPSTEHDTGTDRTRAYSVDYLKLATSRLTVITSAQATKINWTGSKDASGNVVAQGVSFVPVGGGPSSSVNVNKEVILSAGTVQTPQLLELSGVGDSSVLSGAGVSSVVNLPAVGTNLQDHACIVDVFKLKPGVDSLDELSSNQTALNAALADFSNGQGILTQALYPLAYLQKQDFLSTDDINNQLPNLGSRANNPQLTDAQYQAATALYNANVPIMELLAINTYFGNSSAQPNTNYISLAACLQNPLSRGDIHISTSDPLAKPTINPRYLQSPLDGFLLARAGQFLRNTAAKGPLAQYIDSEAEPGTGVQSDAEWAEWVKSVVRTEYHPIGTASLQSQSAGGVVAPNLKVYGTSNVRVVDLSVAPLHVSSHTQTVAYAIAEMASSMILAGK